MRMNPGDFRWKILIQEQDPDTEEWHVRWTVFARVNKKNGGQSFNADADQYRAELNFDIRYFREIENVRYNPQPYRIVYSGHFFKVTDYDDYMEQHAFIRITGAHYA